MFNLIENVFWFILDAVLLLSCLICLAFICIFHLGFCTLTCFLWCRRIWDACNRVNDRVICKFLDAEQWMGVNIFHKDYNKQQGDD
jgi:hypothetical protein